MRSQNTNQIMEKYDLRLALKLESSTSKEPLSKNCWSCI